MLIFHWTLSIWYNVLSFIYIVKYISHSFLSVAKQYSLCGYTTLLFIVSVVDGHQGCVHFRDIIPNAAVNICVQVFLQTVFISIVFVTKTEITTLYDTSIFHLKEMCHTISTKSLQHVIRSHQQCMKVPIFPKLANMCYNCPLITVVLVGMKSYLTVVLMFIS